MVYQIELENSPKNPDFLKKPGWAVFFLKTQVFNNPDYDRRDTLAFVVTFAYTIYTRNFSPITFIILTLSYLPNIKCHLYIFVRFSFMITH